MRMLVSVVFGFVLTALAGASGSELVDSDLSPEEVIERLKQVRKDWEEVEIEFAQFERRPNLFGPEPRLAKWGRFVLRPGDCGEWETFAADKEGRKLEGDPEVRYVWTPDEFQIHSPNGHVEAISRVELRRLKAKETDWAEEERSPENKIAEQEPARRKHPEQKPDSLGQVLLRGYISLWATVFTEVARRAILESPKDYLPLVYADDAATLAERFDLSVKENDENIFLFACPRLLEDQGNFRQTAISIDRQTFIPVAKLTVLPSGRDCFTWVVTSLRVNGKDVAVRLALTGEQSRE